ncbi:fimbrial protein [Pseudocitrobacter cyperus]|uniref:Fimbrial protein n=1 Tax=Pseudocitrobacter cyperus TaxID=3112843 RepID=A0ABV0HJS3_9ENTR
MKNFTRNIIIPAIVGFVPCSVYAANADCIYSGAAEGMKSTQSIDLSKIFETSTTYSTSISTNFTQTLTCNGLAIDTIKFQTQGSEPYYVNFTDASGISDYWVKITTSISPASTKMKSPASLKTRSMSDYQATITLTAELVSAPSATLSYYKSTSNGTATIPVAAAGRSETTQEDYFIQVARDSFSVPFVYAVQSLNITYSPSTMTCDVQDQTVRLPAIGINDLLEGNSNGMTAFSLPISCNSDTGLALSNVNTWLMSNDIVDSGNKVLRNEESSSTGIGISLQDESGSDVAFGATSVLTDAVTRIKTISKGESLEEGEQDVKLNAYYKVYDSVNAQPGSVNATATVMFSYN